MDGSIVLGSSQRKRLLEIYRGPGGKELHHPQVRLRAHVILLLSEGHSWSLIAAVLFCSTATIARWKGRFESGGVDALLEERRGRAATLLVGWALVLVGWVKQLTPRDFGYCRGSTELAEVQGAGLLRRLRLQPGCRTGVQSIPRANG